MQILLIITGLTGLWDGFTTFYGISGIMGTKGVGIIASAFFALVIAGFLFGTKTIWDNSRNNPIAPILKFLWFVAFLYDIYTSFYGNKEFILNGYVNDEQMIMLIGMTILVSGSPIIYSYLIDNV
jgi:hypothetical protein